MPDELKQGQLVWYRPYQGEGHEQWVTILERSSSSPECYWVRLRDGTVGLCHQSALQPPEERR